MTAKTPAIHDGGSYQSDRAIEDAAITRKSYTVEICTMVYATVEVDAESSEAAMEAVLEGDALPCYFVEVSPVAGTGVEVRLDNKGWEVTDADVYGIDDESER